MPSNAAKLSGGDNESRGHEADFLSGGGEMGGLTRAFDWSQTALGELETWSLALRTMVRVLLVNRFPMLLWWGPHYIQIYNDFYRPLVGAKHPRSLGQTVSECWPEIWSILQPLIDTPFKGGSATWIEDFEVEIHRSAITEETHFTVAFSPVPDDAAPNGIGGVLATMHEITEKVIGERRVRVLRDLGTRAAEANTAEEACSRAATTLAQFPKDIPFVLLYLTDAEGERAHLAASSGFEQGTGIDPAVIELSEEHSDKTWPLAIVKHTGEMQVVENLSDRLPKVPPGPWTDPTHSAVVLPIRSNISNQFSGFLVAGLSSRLKLDEGYKNFLELATAQIATAISNAGVPSQSRSTAIRAEAFTSEALTWLPDNRDVTSSENDASGAERRSHAGVGQPRILLADDNADMREYIRRSLGNDYEVVTASDGEEALRKIKELQARVSTHLQIEYSRRESVKREAALRAEAEASRDKVLTVLESITDGFEALDKNWNVTYANAEAGRLTGIRPEDMLGKNHWDLFPGAVGTMVHSELLRAADERVPVDFHNYYAAWDRWFHLKAYPAADGGLSVFYEDVTSHHRAEEERVKANQLLTAMFDSSIDPIAAKDLDGRYIAMNEACVRFIGRPAAELIGLTDREFADPQIADPIMAVDVEALRTHEVKHAEEQYPDLSGKMHWFQSIKAPLREIDGTVTGLVIVARDITEQKEVEKALKQRETNQAFLLQLTDALRNLPDPEDVVTAATALLGGHLAAGSVGYSETDPTDSYVTIIRDWTAAPFPTVVRTHLLDDYGPQILAELRAGRTVRVNDVKVDPQTGAPLQQIADAIDIQAFVIVPLIRNGRFASLLFVLNKTPRVWTKIEVSLIEEVAARVWASVEKARSETALRESEARYRAAIQANSSVLWTNNARGEMVGEQPAWGAFTGQQIEEYQGFGWSKAIHPEDAQPSINAWKEAVAAKRTFVFEHRVRRHDGTWRVCSVRAVPVFDKNENIIEWVGVTNDINEERILLTALQESEARYRILAEQITDGIFIAHRHGRYVDANAAAAAMLGYSLDELLTLTIPEVLVRGESEKLPQEFERLANGQTIQSDWRFRRKDGSQFIGDLIGRQLADGRIQAVVRDVTERRQIEDELRRVNSDLEQFAYSASHDLQEPLRSVSIYSELLATRHATGLDDEALEFLGYLRTGALRMESLIHDLLAYTQVTVGDLANAEADAQEALNAALSNLSGATAASQARVTCDPLPRLAVQSLHLHQLFQNLVGNAIKYRSPNAPPQVHIKAERQNVNWLFSVRDNGIGIDPEYQDRVFGLFKRLHTGDEYSGTGLGLAICQKIVERYHGRIWVESELGSGSTFYFLLPAMVQV